MPSIRICVIGLSVLGILGIYGADKDSDDFAPHPGLIAVFGSEKSDPINNGYVFVNDAYVTPPYIVERRGLDIYINSQFIIPGPDWVAPGSVKEPENPDPGDPPIGSHPDDETPKSTADYWDAEIFYVGTHFKPEIAAKKLSDVILKADPLTKPRIVIAEDKESSAVYWTVKGKESCTAIVPWELKVPKSPPKERALASAKATMQGYVSEISAGQILIAYSTGGEAGIGGNEVTNFMQILVSDGSPIEKMKKLETAGLYKPTDGMLTEFLKAVKIPPDLVARVAAIKPEEPDPLHGYKPPKLPPLPKPVLENPAIEPTESPSASIQPTSPEKIPEKSSHSIKIIFLISSISLILLIIAAVRISRK